MEIKPKKLDNNGFNFAFFKRFSKLQSLLFPGICSLPVGLFGLLLSFALLGIQAHSISNLKFSFKYQTLF